MIERVCDQHQLLKHSLYFIFFKSLSKTESGCLSLGVEQFPNRTSNNFFIISSFLTSMSALIFLKVSQNQTKLQQNKTKNDDFFCQKKSSSEPSFTKSEGKVRFGHSFFENDPLDEPKKIPTSKKCIFFRSC